MNYKLQAQKAILVAGLMATAYAQACYVIVSTGITCENSGSTVDSTSWPNGPTLNIISTSNWTSQNMQYASSGGSTLTDYVYCHGPAKFTDQTGHVNTVNDWYAGTIDGLYPSAPAGTVWGQTSGDNCM
jgi:hypothetical protein